MTFFISMFKSNNVLVFMFQSEIDIMLTNLSSLIYSTRVFEKSLNEEWKKGHDYIVSVESLFTFCL